MWMLKIKNIVIKYLVEVICISWAVAIFLYYFYVILTQPEFINKYKIFLDYIAL